MAILPRRIASLATTVSITGAGPSTPAWVGSIQPGEFASIPVDAADRIPGANCSPGYSAQSQLMQGSDGAFSWVPTYGTHGALLIYGGGHGTNNFCYVWAFDVSIPGWRPINVVPPSGVIPNNTFVTPGGAAWKWDDGAECSAVQANMPADAIFLNNYGPDMWCKPRINTDWWGYPNGTAAQFPVATRFYYGECATNIPLGFHPYNFFIAIPPGKLGMGAYGGLAGVGKASMTTNSAQGCVWGHKIDLATGTWSRMAYRLPNNTTDDKYIENNTAMTWYSSATRGDFMYTVGKTSSIIKTSLDTGVHTALPTSTPRNTMNNVEFLGTTQILCSFAPTDVGSLYNHDGPSVWSQWTLRCASVDPALTKAQRQWKYITNWSPANVFPSGAGEATNGFMSAGLCWVPEVQKFAILAFSNPSLEAQDGYWPTAPTIYWITPPANAESTWDTGVWQMETEVLTIPVSDPYGNVRDNLRPRAGMWRNLYWASSLRSFLYFNSQHNNHTYFFRSTKVP